MSKTLEFALRIVAQTTGNESIKKMADAVGGLGQTAEDANPQTKALAEQIEQLAAQQSLVQQFDNATRALKAQEIVTAAVAMRLDELKKETAAAGPGMESLEQSIQGAEQQLTQMRSELVQQAGSHQKLQTELKQSGIDTKQLAAEKQRLQTEFKQSSTQLKTLANDYLKANNAQDKLATSTGNLTSTVLGLAGTYLGIDRLWQSLTGIFQTGADFEKLDVQFKALMGSFAGGEQASAWVKNFAKTTPLQLEEVSQAFVRLKAFGLDPMDGTLQAIVDQAFKLGGGFQEVEGISLALGQAWAKQKLQGEEILQLIERGVPVWDLLAQVTGKNTIELQKLSEQGKLGRDVIRQLMDEIGNQAKGAAAENMTLLSGLISNAKDNLAQFYDLIARSGSMDWLKQQIGDLNREFEAMAADGRLQDWAQSISDAIVSTGTAIKDTASLIYEFRQEIALLAQAWAVLKVGRFLGDLVDGGKAAIVQLKALTTSTAVLGAETDKAARSSRGLASVLKTGFALVGVDWAIGKMVEFKDAVIALRSSTGELDKSKRALANSERLLAAELAALSAATGLQIQSMKDLNQAEADGLIVYDEKINAYRSATAAQEQSTTAAVEQVGQLKLTAEQASEAATRILSMADAFVVADNTADSMNKQLSAVIEGLKSGGTQYESQIQQLERLADKNRDEIALYGFKQAMLKDTESAYKSLGLQSADALNNAALKAQAAYQVIAEGNAPVEMQKAAFMGWAKAALESANATGQTVPEVMKTTAANLGLSSSLDALINKSNGVAQAFQASGKSYSNLERDVLSASTAVKKYQDILSDSKSTTEQKAQASKMLAAAEEQLTAKTELLNKAKQFETQTFGDLQTILQSYQQQMENLDQLYIRGAITAEEYNNQKREMVEIINLLQQQMGGLANAQTDATAAIDKANMGLREQQDEMEALSERTGRAVRYVNMYTDAQSNATSAAQYASQSTEELTEKYRTLSNRITEYQGLTGMFWDNWGMMQAEVLKGETAIITQELRYRELRQELESGTVSMYRLAKIQGEVASNFNVLDATSLATLEDSIDAAHGRLKSLRDDLTDTVQDLRRELLQLRGDTETLEAEAQAAKKAELTNKLTQAQQLGDQDAINAAQQALSLMEQINQEKRKQAAAPTTTTPAARAVSTPTPQLVQPQPTNTVSRTVRLVLDVGSRDIQADMTENDAAQLMAALERLKGTSLS